MWRLCCIIHRKESKIIEIQRHSKVSADILPAVSTEPASSLASLCCDDCRRPSWNKSNGHTGDSLARRHSTPYFEVDLETGRRPTLVVETTARLAVAESTDLEHSRRSSCISAQAVYKPLLGMTHRFKGTSGSPLVDTEKLKPPTLDDDVPDESESSTRHPSHKKMGFTKLRSPGSSFRKRMFLKKSEKSAFPRLNFKSRINRPQPKVESNDNEPITQMQITPLHNACSAPGSRRDSLYIFSHADEPIVTPFAQILASLRKVRANFICLTNVHSSRE